MSQRWKQGGLWLVRYFAGLFAPSVILVRFVDLDAIAVRAERLIIRASRLDLLAYLRIVFALVFRGTPVFSTATVDVVDLQGAEIVKAAPHATVTEESNDAAPEPEALGATTAIDFLAMLAFVAASVRVNTSTVLFLRSELTGVHAGLVLLAIFTGLGVYQVAIRLSIALIPGSFRFLMPQVIAVRDFCLSLGHRDNYSRIAVVTANAARCS